MTMLFPRSKRLRLVAPLPLMEAIPVDQAEVEAVLQEIIVVEDHDDTPNNNHDNHDDDDGAIMWLESAAIPERDGGVMMAEVVIL
jgi:hypothetical protein